MIQALERNIADLLEHMPQQKFAPTKRSVTINAN